MNRLMNFITILRSYLPVVWRASKYKYVDFMIIATDSGKLWQHYLKKRKVFKESMNSKAKNLRLEIEQ